MIASSSWTLIKSDGRGWAGDQQVDGNGGRGWAATPMDIPNRSSLLALIMIYVSACLFQYCISVH
jgi:hypothetical protein